MSQEVNLRVWEIQFSGKSTEENNRYRANRSLSVAAPDLMTALKIAEREAPKGFSEITILGVSPRGPLHYVSTWDDYQSADEIAKGLKKLGM